MIRETNAIRDVRCPSRQRGRDKPQRETTDIGVLLYRNTIRSLNQYNNGTPFTGMISAEV